MIARHHNENIEFINEDIARYEKAWNEDIVNALKKRPAENLGPEFREVLSIMALSIVGQLSKDHVKRYLDIATHLGIANFESAMKPGVSFSVNIDGEVVELSGTATTAYTDTETWINAFYCAVIARSSGGIETLCAVPESIHANSDIKPDNFDLAFVRMLKGMYNPDVNIGELLVDAMEKSFPDNISGARMEYVDNILVPQISLYERILSHEPDEFNKDLEDAVLKHRNYWGSKKNKYDSIGWIALPLIGIAAIAYDNPKIEMVFSTEYIPDWLVRHKF